MLRVLLVQTQDQTAQFLARFFKERGDAIAIALDLGQAATYLTEFKPDLMVLDLHFRGDAWLPFLRLVRLDFPEIKILVTNRHPDLQREMRAREQGVKVFVRQPFTQYWLNKALKSLGISMVVPASQEAPTRPIQSTAGSKAPLRVVRIPMRVKITLPYVILSVLFALGAAYLISQVILQNAQDRFYNQLVDSRVQASDWMVSEEDKLLESQRLITSLDGLSAAVKAANSEALRSMILPLIVNADEEVVEVIDMQGVSLLTVRKTLNSEAGEYSFSKGSVLPGETPFIQAVLAGQVDEHGDKFAGMMQLPDGDYFYIAGPIYDENGNRTGALLIGCSLNSVTEEIRASAFSEVTLYTPDGQPVASTLFSPQESFPVASTQVRSILTNQDSSNPTRNLTIRNLDYVELLGPWEVRAGEDLGLLGVALPQNFLSTSSQSSRWQVFALVAGSILLVIGLGLYLSGLITAPLHNLVAASSEIAAGNLDVKVEVKGDDEVAALAQSFNRMVSGLQEGVIYRDILGRSATPDKREQLRQMFSSGNFKLEGQEAVGTVLYTNVRGFTSIAEQTEPTRVFDWLNEYISRLVPIITGHDGVVNKFDGDSMLAFFGILPEMLNPQESALSACQAGLEILHAVETLNSERIQRGEPPMVTGIGINTGVMIAGGLGSNDRIHYTIIGDTVNTTQRLELLTREIYKSNGILISHATYTALGERANQFAIDPMGRRMVRGKTEKLIVYKLLPSVSVVEMKDGI